MSASPTIPEAPVASPPKLQSEKKAKVKSKGKKNKEKEKDLGDNDDKVQRPKTPPPADEFVARRAMRHFIAGQLFTAGFSNASPSLLDEIERNAIIYLTDIFHSARNYAQSSLRTEPNVLDVVAACQDIGLEVRGLQRAATKRKKRKSMGSSLSLSSSCRSNTELADISFVLSARSTLPLVPSAPVPSIPSFLPSDSSDDEKSPKDSTVLSLKLSKKLKASQKDKDKDKDGASDPKKAKKKEALVPPSLREIPKHLPSLPPKHTYLRTAPPKPVKRTLASLEARYENALLVQESLRSLVQGTEDHILETTGAPTPPPNAILPLPALPNGHPIPFASGSAGGSGAASPIQRSNPSLGGAGLASSLSLSLKIGENAGGESAKDKEEKNASAVVGGGALPPPSTLEELGMGGLVNYEMMERTLGGTKRRRWKV